MKSEKKHIQYVYSRIFKQKYTMTFSWRP